MDNEQLYKRQDKNYKKVYPNTLLSSILDKESGKSLKDIINTYNHLYTPFNNTIYDTLVDIPIEFRRKGLWVTYSQNNIFYTYEFQLSTSESADDSLWGDLSNWKRIYPIIPKHGTSNNKPENPFIGEQYFDDDLGIPIWWNGVAWVNYNGVIMNNVTAVQGNSEIRESMSENLNSSNNGLTYYDHDLNYSLIYQDGYWYDFAGNVVE